MEFWHSCKYDGDLPPTGMLFFENNAYLGRRRPVAALTVSISLGDVSAPFCLTNFSYVPRLRHNAAVSKLASCKPLNWKDLAGAWRFEPQTSCAQGRRFDLAKHRILNAANHFAQCTVVRIVVSDRLFAIACTIPAMRKVSSFPVAIFFCSSAG